MNTISSFSFGTLDERASIIAANPNLILIQEQNLDTGNTLFFSDMADEKYTKSLEDQLLIAENTIAGGLL